MKSFGDLPIRTKMIFIFLAITLPALFLMSSFFVYNDLKFFKNEMVRTLTVLGNVVGGNSRASLIFDDEFTGKNILSSLKKEKPIISAALYDKDGNIFATYSPDEGSPFRPPTTLEDGTYLYKDHIEIILPIFLDADKVGKIYLHSNLSEFEARKRTYLFFTSMIFLLILFLAFMITIKLQNIITKPILTLASTTKEISYSSNYSIRVKHEGKDEIGTLFSGFNEMLTQIEKRERELASARKILEEKVIECNLASKELEKSEETTRTILENAFDAIITMDSEGSITSWNRRASSIFGWSANEAIGRKLVNLIIPTQYRESHTRGLARFLATGEYEILNQQIEITGLHREGRTIPIEISVSATEVDNLYIFTGVIRDITQRKETERELIRSREHLRNLSRNLQSAREEEKNRIARQIHDELGQALTALKLDISWMKKRFTDQDSLIIEKSESMMKLIEETIEVVQTIATELRPQMLDILGLCETLRWQAQEFHKRTGTPCDLIIEPEEIPIDQERSTALFRIFQEALTNVARHSQATKVRTSLKKKDNNLLLEINDDGIGMDENLLDHPQSLGLIGIRERALVLGGKMHLRSRGGEGTTLTITIPISQSGSNG